MKKILFAILTISACLVATSCSNYKARKLAEQERAQFVKDSIARVEFVRDSIALENKRAQEARERRAQFVRDSIQNAENQKTIARCSKLFRVREDEFNSIKWYYPKAAPQTLIENGCFCYFAYNNVKASNLRFKFQYFADNWLFIDKIIFSIDGMTYQITPDMKRDNAYGKIWEWTDIQVVKNATSSSEIDEKIIKRIISAQTVKMKLVGSNYSKVQTLSAKQIKAFKDCYDYYFALGGEIY